MDKEKNQTLQMVKMSITLPGKAEYSPSHTSHVDHSTHDLHTSLSHTFGFNGDVPT